MFKKLQDKNNHVIRGLADQCELLEKQIEMSVHEILKLVESINIDLKEEVFQESIESTEVENEEQTSHLAS